MQDVTAGTGATGTTGAGGSGTIATDETDRLIASDKVEGTAVYNRQGERLGSVHNFMVDKRSGRVAYAVTSFGGLLGVGGSYHPLPWGALTYDTDLGGYVADIDKDRLRGAPSHGSGEGPAWDRAYGDRIDRYYGTSPYWGESRSG
jgi:PRC-barrel domain